MAGVWQQHPRYTLAFRLARSEHLYQQMLMDRKALIKKWGPTVQDHMVKCYRVPFSTLVGFLNHEPFPAYTTIDFASAAYNCPHE
ncbi:Methyltranfer-dom domain-containing protein [Mycena sanguinolenta]|uniref:Methyltranfer-dom domain-containing protein n=1 Tax=Mycena sanguinolenta TaxID=230812 RepID=A0A8H7DKU3_9AGAR|nr:Methyltranfer-dom domain-containing protein [Mycena sanguinolenta]